MCHEYKLSGSKTNSVLASFDAREATKVFHQFWLLLTKEKPQGSLTKGIMGKAGMNSKNRPLGSGCVSENRKENQLMINRCQISRG